MGVGKAYGGRSLKLSAAVTEDGSNSLIWGEMTGIPVPDHVPTHSTASSAYLQASVL